MAEYESGTAFVQFVGSFDGMVRQVTKEATKDGRLFVQAFNREVEKGLRGLDLGPSGAESVRDGAQAGDRYAEGFKARVRASGAAKIKVDADTAGATAKLAALDRQAKQTGKGVQTSLIGALLAIAPATVPLVATAGGALAGLVPVAATVALGISGINKELKDGSLAGTKYADDLNTIKNEGVKLQQIAAGGLLAGIDKGLASSHGLFGELNRDIGVMSGQLGDIVAGTGPALLTILHGLNPLFVDFGNAIDSGAKHLEAWTQNSDGIEHFVAYVQSELPDVEQLLGQLITLIGHLAEGAAPFGGALLNDINMFVGALNKIPIGVLQTAIPLAVSLYAAFKTYGAITAIVNGTTKAITTLGNAFGLTGPKAAASAAAQTAAMLSVQAASAEEAAAVAASQAEVAAAAAESAVATAAALEGTGSVLAASATAAADAAIVEAAAFQAAADAAIASATEISASAEAAAAASATAGEAAAVGWSAMLGPIGAVVIGGGLLATMFLRSGSSAADAAADVNTLTEAIKSDGDAIGENTRKRVVNTLAQEGALYAAQKLGIGASTLTDAVLGNGDAYQRVAGQLRALNAANADAYVKGEKYNKQVQAIRQHNSDLYDQGKLTADQLGKRFNVVQNLNQVLEKQRGITKDAVASDKLQAAAMNTGTAAMQHQQIVAAALYGLTGAKGVAAYLAAKQAAQQNTQQTKSQTLAYQLENDAASLLDQTLQKLAGKNATVLEAQTALRQANLQVRTAFKGTGTAIQGATKDAVAHQQALQGHYQAAVQLAEAIGKQTGSSKAERKSLIDSRDALEQVLEKQHKLTPAVQAYINKLYDVKNLKIPPTKLDVTTARAEAKARAYIRWLQSLPTVTIGVDFAANRRSTRSSQVPGSASGTNGRGLPRGVSAVGERGPELAVNDGSRVEILSNTQSRAFLAMTGMTAPGFAGGTASHIGPGGSDARITDLISSGFFGSELIKALHQLGLQVTATTRGVAASVRAVAREAQQSVSRQIAAAVAPAVTSIPGLREQLTRGVSHATTDREHLDIAKRNLDVLNKHAQTLKHDANELQNQAKQAQYAATQMETGSKAASAAKTAAEEQARALKHQADAAGKVADAVGKMADRGKAAYEKLKEAAQSASQKAQQDAQALIAAVQSEFDTLQQNIQTFESGIQSGLTGGSDLATIWGNLSSNADSAKQALDAAQQAVQQAVPNAAAFAQAQSDQAAASRELAVAYAQLQAAQSSGDAAAITAAQQAQSAAAQKLAVAQAAVQQNTPTPDQLVAQAQAQQQLADAQQAYNAAVQQASASGVADVLKQFAASEQQFASDLTKLQKAGAGQDLINQLASMGAAGGDALAQGLINDPASLAAVSKSMDAINNIAGKEGDKLAQGYYGAGVKSMEQLLKGIEKQFPSLVKALAPLAAELAAMFTFTPTVAGTAASAVGAKTVTIDHIHQLQTVAKMYGVSMSELIAANPSLKGDSATSAVRKGTKLVIPSFASGVEDFAGGLAYVHKNELLVNLPKGTNVYPQITPASQLPGSALAQLAAGGGAGDMAVAVYIGDEAIDPRLVRIVQRANVNWARGAQHVGGDALSAMLSPHAQAAMRP